MGLIWYLFWLWLCFEKPSLHPTISARELNYIETSLGAVKQSAAPTIVNTPWKEFFTSMPVYAIIVANFCRSWNFYLLVLFQASYLHSFNFEVSAVSIIKSYCFVYRSDAFVRNVRRKKKIAMCLVELFFF